MELAPLWGGLRFIMQATLKKSDPHPLFAGEPVNALIVQTCAASSGVDDVLTAALHYHLNSGGKQVRAGLCLSVGTALGVQPDTNLRLAAAIECLHNASLIQDDLQDKSPLRRDLPSVWKKFGSGTAICLTDLLLSSAYGLLAECQPAERLGDLLRHFHFAISDTLRGQMADTGEQDIGNRTTSAEACLNVAVAKSGPFFALALELPLLVAGKEELLQTARSAAMQFGKGYQAFDDLEDVEQDEREGNFHNLVLAFHRDGFSVGSPIEKAVATARWHLDAACRDASLLPNNCGELLVEEAENLKSRLHRLIG
jgi:geranylgeranyl pyrophosphate synthase